MRSVLPAACFLVGALLATAGCSLVGSDPEVYDGLYSAGGSGDEFEFASCVARRTWAIRRDYPEARPLLERFEEVQAELPDDTILTSLYARVEGSVEGRGGDAPPLLDVEEVLEIGEPGEEGCR